ncbi:helix-turn-helix transcriptional regulator [Kineosporia sp. A_224]|uniref:helix-turn-helix domain-containing protein n=1 Tax=Kineosporia sp. A_224 TaxID=1962180 RepID=UPI001304495D|nr:helix-turn-helix transcriptional regulator [Kineosporia sp. A_224]
MTTFSERLRRLRQAANLSQVQLAGEDLSPSYISLLESGKRQPSDDVAALLAERLGCAVEDLLTPIGEERRKQAQLSIELAKLSLLDGRPDDARQRLEALLAEEGLDRALRDDAVWELTEAYEKVIDLDRAIASLLPIYERALAGATHLPLPSVAIYLSHLYQAAGDMNAAIRVGEGAVRLLNDKRETTTREYFRLVATLSAAYFGVGDAHLAKAYLDDAMQIAQRFADPQGEAALAWNAAVNAESLGRLDEALLLSRKALAILSEHAGGHLDVARLRWTAAYLTLQHDPSQVAEARRLLDLVEPDLPRFGPVEAAMTRATLATVHLLEGSPRAAEDLAREALVALAAYPGGEQVRTHLVLGDAIAAQGRLDEALERYVAAVDSLDALPATRETAALWRETADRFVRYGRLDEALDGYRSALDAVAIRSTAADVALAMETARQRAESLGDLFAEGFAAEAESAEGQDRRG